MEHLGILLVLAYISMTSSQYRSISHVLWRTRRRSYPSGCSLFAVEFLVYIQSSVRVVELLDRIMGYQHMLPQYRLIRFNIFT